MLEGFVTWLVVSVILIICLVAYFVVIHTGNNMSSNTTVGRMIARDARETEQDLYTNFLPGVLAFVLGIPAFAIFCLLCGSIGFDNTIILIITVVVLFYVVLFGAIIYMIFGNKSN